MLPANNMPEVLGLDAGGVHNIFSATVISDVLLFTAAVYRRLQILSCKKTTLKKLEWEMAPLSLLLNFWKYQPNNIQTLLYSLEIMGLYVQYIRGEQDEFLKKKGKRKTRRRITTAEENNLNDKNKNLAIRLKKKLICTVVNIMHTFLLFSFSWKVSPKGTTESLAGTLMYLIINRRIL